MLKAIREDVLKVGGLELRVAILEDGQRVIETKSLELFFENLGDSMITDDDTKEIAKFIRGQL